MRLSIRNTDHHSYNPTIQEVDHVTLDGETLNYCIMADEELGEALCYATDENGDLLPYSGADEEPTVMRYGVVVIHFKEGVR